MPIICVKYEGIPLCFHPNLCSIEKKKGLNLII